MRLHRRCSGRFEVGCKPAETAILDLGAAEALLAEQPNEPIDEVFVCDVFDAAANIIQTFTVKMPKEKAAAFQAEHPIKAGHPMPAGAMKP